MKHLELPSSVREITCVTQEMYKLDSIYIDNEFYRSNDEGTAIYTRDGSELICVNYKVIKFEIPYGTRVIKKSAFCGKISGNLLIPSTVENIEKGAFFYCDELKDIEFVEITKMRLCGSSEIQKLENLTVNIDNFIEMENGVVILKN